MRDLYRKIYYFNTYNRDHWVKSWAARIPDGSRVLDVGAGTGRYRSFFEHCDYYAHDFAQTPALAGRYTALDYESDITDIPVSNNEFNVVLCTEVLEHVPEPIKALEEIARILKTGGRLLLTAPLGSFLHQEPYHFYGGFTPYWYQRFLPEVGLRIESIEPNGGFFSLFGQEAIRFSTLARPHLKTDKGPLVWISLTILWVVTLPLFRGLLPLLGLLLDTLGLEKIATVGYHVVATKADLDA